MTKSRPPGTNSRTVGEYLHAAEALIALTMASTSLKLIPFRWIARWLGVARPTDDTPPVPEAPLSTLPAEIHRPDTRITAVQVAVERASRHALLRPTCLSRAMAGRALLKRRGIASTVIFGVGFADDQSRKLGAHAWLIVEGEAILGGAEAKDFQPIARFP